MMKKFSIGSCNSLQGNLASAIYQQDRAPAHWAKTAKAIEISIFLKSVAIFVFTFVIFVIYQC